MVCAVYTFRMKPKSSARRLLCVVAALTGAAVFTQSRGAAQTTSRGLHIVVIAGEDAVNVIQQKTAVAPVIEVRDRNDQPVAGAVVNFVIRSGRATFSGARTLSVTTNAAGRAAAAGFAPTGSGALQISTTAVFQGQTAATVTISQTTVQTAAQAAAVSSAGGAGGSSGGSSAGSGAGGGGLSGTTLGVVGGAAAAGAVVATKTLLGGGFTHYEGPFAGTLPLTFPPFPGFSLPCTRNEAQVGRIEIDLTDNNGTLSGGTNIDASVTITPGTCNPNSAGTETLSNLHNGLVTGTAASLTYNSVSLNNRPPPDNSAYFFSFSGALTGNEVTGVLTIRREIGSASGSVAHNVRLPITRQ